VVPDTKSRTLQVEIRENVKPGSEIHTDAMRSYRGLDPEYIHNVVDHAERYVDGPTFTRTDLRTSGAYSSGPSREPT
ncbi:MAG: transposase, partial [Rubrobacteraceae bacterium]